MKTTENHIETNSTESLQRSDKVWVKNQGGKWLSGCVFICRIDDELSKPFLVEDWNGFERRFHFVRKAAGSCDICHSYKSKEEIQCNECKHLFGVCSECLKKAAKYGGIPEIICPNCQSSLGLT